MNYSKNLGAALNSIFGNDERMTRLRSTKHWHVDGVVLTFVCMDGGYDLTDAECKALVSIVCGFLREERFAQCGE